MGDCIIENTGSLIKKLREALGGSHNGTVLSLMTVESEFGKRAMGRHMIRDATHLVHGQTYLIRRGALDLDNNQDEAEEVSEPASQSLAGKRQAHFFLQTSCALVPSPDPFMDRTYYGSII